MMSVHGMHNGFNVETDVNGRREWSLRRQRLLKRCESLCNPQICGRVSA